MARPLSIKPGDRYGKLVVISVKRSGVRGKHASAECLCEGCGKQTTMTSHIVKKSKSCGCLRHCSSTWDRKKDRIYQQTLPSGEAAARSLYYQYKRRAKSRNLEFSLTLDEFKTLCTSDCEYCGCEPTRKYNGGRSQSSTKPMYNGDFVSNGIDRVEPLIGYVINNCVPCCAECNFAKGSRSADQFIKHAARIAAHTGDILSC